MKISKELKALKAKSQKYKGLAIPFTFTQKLAFELLSHRVGNRSLDMQYAMAYAFEILSQKETTLILNPICIIQQSNDLIQGAHLLVGFILSGRKKMKFNIVQLDLNDGQYYYS